MPTHLKSFIILHACCLALSFWAVTYASTGITEYNPDKILDFMNNSYETKYRPYFQHKSRTLLLLPNYYNDREEVMREISYGTPIQVTPLFKITDAVLSKNQQGIEKFINQAAQLKKLRYENELKKLQTEGSANDYVSLGLDNQQVTKKQAADDSYLKGDLELLKQEALQQLLVPIQSYYNDHFIVPVYHKKKIVGYQFFNPSQSDDYLKTKIYEAVSARSSWEHQSLPFYPFRVTKEKAMGIAKQNVEPILINASNLRNRPDYGQLYWFFFSSQEFVSLTTGGLYKLTDQNNKNVNLENIAVQLKTGTNFAQFYSPAALTTIQPALYTRPPLKHIFLEHKYLIIPWGLMPVILLINFYSFRQRRKKRRELRF